MLARALALYVGAHFVASPLAVVTMAWGAQGWALRLALWGQLAFVIALAAGLALGGLAGGGLGGVGGDGGLLRLVFSGAWRIGRCRWGRPATIRCARVDQCWRVCKVNVPRVVLPVVLRVALNRWRRKLLRSLLFRPVFGERSQGHWLPHTRISPSTCIEHEDKLRLADHIYIGHFNYLEASGGITIDEGVQITHHVSIVTHSSHRAQRLLGREFSTWDANQPRPGWVSGPVHIGPYCFIGPHTLIEANSRLGRGCIVCAGSQVRGDFTDFSILEGSPARVVGDSRKADEKLLVRHPELYEFYDAWAGGGCGPAVRHVLIGDAESPHLLKWARALAPHVELWVASSRGFLPGFDACVPPERRLALGATVAHGGGNIGLLRQLPRLARWLQRIDADWLHPHYPDLARHAGLAGETRLAPARKNRRLGLGQRHAGPRRSRARCGAG